MNTDQLPLPACVATDNHPSAAAASTDKMWREQPSTDLSRSHMSNDVSASQFSTLRDSTYILSRDLSLAQNMAHVSPDDLERELKRRQWRQFIFLYDHIKHSFIIVV